MRGLVHNTHVIQHVLRQNIIPKASDRINTTPLLSVVIYFFLTNISFNAADFMIQYNENLTIIRSPRSKKYNLALGHVIAYLLEIKCNIYPTKPDHIPSHFTDHSFYAFFSEKRRPAQAIGQANREEIRTQGEFSAHHHQQQDGWTEHFAHLELRMK